MNNNHNSMLNEIINIVTGKKITSNEAGLLNHAKKRRKKYIRQRITTVLAVIMVFVVTYAMILPGITMTKADQTLACAYETHVHTEACYRDVFDDNGNLIGKELICGQADWTVHEHTDDCFAEVTDADGNVQKILVCDLPEIKEHHHDASCYDTQKVLVCGQIELHTHAKDCYEKDHENDPAYLICGKTELKAHTHGAGCLVKGKATDEAIIGAAEEASNERLAKAESLVRMSAFESTPVGVVESEQETSNAVETLIAEIENEAEEKPSSQAIEKYEEKENPAIEESLGQADNLNEDHSAQTFKASTESLSVTVVAEDGTFPEDTQMAIKDIKDEDTLGVISDAVEGKIEKIHAVDITFLYDDKEIEPSKPVKVAMTPLDSVEEFADAETQIVHVDHDGEVQMIDAAGSAVVDEVAEAAEDEMTDTAVVFEAESFSVYALVYTVEFHYGEFEFSIAGESEVLLSDLFHALAITEDIASVIDVQFSDPELVSVEKLDGDWKMISLNAFTSEEKLTVILRGGVLLEISVTDAQHVDDLALMLENAAIYEEGNLIPWPASVRENKWYDIRLTFKENNVYQFLDTADEMYYPVPEGLDLGTEDFEHDFSMDVGDGVKLEGNTVKYDAATNRFIVKWNTNDKTAFNKLIASNSAEFRLDFKAKFDFARDNIEFSENVSGKIVKDTSFDVDVTKTGEYNHDLERIDYTVTVTSYGEAVSKDGKPAVVVKDELFGTALTYISTGENHGVSWESSLDGAEGHNSNDITLPAASEQPDNGFIVNVGHMDDGEILTFTYSAKVDYEKLTGSGTYDETFNKVVVTTPTGEKEKDHSFTNDLHYVELQKDHTRPINWNGDLATIDWKVTVNENPKVSLGGSSVSDRIYAGDVEAMDYSGSGLHIKVYKKGEPVNEETGEAPTIFVGEYDVPWDDPAITRTSFDIIPGADENTEDEIQYASWTYTIPETQTGTNNGETVTINNKERLWYEITYTTNADKSLMNFDGYIGNEAQEHKTGTEMQDGFYPPGTGTMPEVKKEVEPKDGDEYNAPKGSNEKYIYWTISFDRQKYDLTRCVIEDNSPVQWGHREPVDVATTEAGDYEYLYVEGLNENETWEVTSATDPRTTIKFYRDRAKTKPGLGKSDASYEGGGSNPSNTITIHLRTKNNATWLNNTLTNYWPKNHTNTVTWICNAHQVEDDATATPDVRKIMKDGIQVGTIIKDGVSLPVFRYELFLTGIDADSFDSNGTLVINDVFDTSKLALIAPENLTEANGFEYTQALKDNIGNYRIQAYWDQKLKGYSTNWKGPIDVTTTDYDESEGKKGLTFTIKKADIEAKGLETVTDKDGKETQEYCLRYSLPYYLVVKDADAAKAIAKEAIQSGDEKVKFENTATWTGENPLTDSTTVEAEFKPAQKSIQYNDQRDLATYQLTLNPQGLKLNEGQMIRVEDAYENLAVDFSTIDIQTVPANRKSEINWAYHSNKGTFWIPDETVVIITYQAQPIGDAGKNVTIKNELTMLTWKETVEKTVTLNSESEGSAGDYNIRLFKYQDDFMNQPLPGAIFQLFEVGDGASGDVQRNGRWYKPVTYQTVADVNSGSEEYTHTAADIIADDEFLHVKRMQAADGRELDSVYPTRLHHNKGDAIYFSTGANGYSDIHLSQSRDGLALERGKQYYLYEVVTPDGYDKEDIYWSFIIDDMDFFDSAHGIYQYRDGGVLTVSNESSQDKGIVISKSFTGDARDALNWNQVQFEIVGVDKDDNEVFRRDVSFADFVKYKLKLPTLPSNGKGPYTYTITEKNADVNTATRTTKASVIKTSAGNIDTDGKPVQTIVVPESTLDSETGLKVSFQVTDDDLKQNAETAFKVAFENNYVEKPVELMLSKEWGTEAQKLTDKSVTLALYMDGEEYPLCKNGDEYKPMSLSESDPKLEATRISLNDKTGWTVMITDLPRYEKGKPIQWTVKEVGATYTQDGVTHTVAEEDMDMQFNITAKQQTGMDDNGAAVYETVKVEKAEAKIDTTSVEKANLTLNNEKSKMTTVKVEKKWYDEKGNDITSSKTADDAVTYDLYRTTDDLPKGGKERELFTIDLESGQHDGKTILLTKSIELLADDVINIHIVSGKESPSDKGETWNGEKNYDFAGIFAHVDGPIYNGEQIWQYPFDVIKITGYDGSNSVDLLTNRTNRTRLVKPGHYIDGIGNWSNKYEYIDLQVKMTKEYFDHIDSKDEAGNLKLTLRSWYWSNISVTNITQESENLTHASLEKFVQDHPSTTTLYRENLTLGELEQEKAKWESTNNYPDGYTYFAIEHTPAQYSDSYSVVDTKDAEGNVTGQTITIENRPVKLEEGQTLGTLTVQKAVSGLPEGNYTDKEFQFRVKNGTKYLVKTGTDGDGNATYELMSIVKLTEAGKTLEADATYTIKAGESEKLTFDGLYPAIYTIEEVGNPQVPGFTLETTYSGNGRIGVNLNQTSSATITNTYTPEETKVIFGKIWADGDNKPVVWPEDQSIEVVVHRSVKGVGNSEDTNFALTYTISGGTATLNTDKSKMPDPELVENAEIKVIADNAVSPYYAYRYELSGLSKKVLTGDSAEGEWVYYITETVPSDATFESGYGSLNGTAVNIVSGKTNAETKTDVTMSDTEYIINKLSAKEISFKKNWFDGINLAALSTWPQREKEKELDSEGNVVNPDAPAEYEDVPISVTLKRKLQYGLLKKETGYDPNFAISFNDLTSSDTAREQNTPEGKLTLTMVKDGNDFNYTISGLKQKGTLEGQSGEWMYYIVESAVNGYAASYQLSSGTASEGVFTNEGGTIQNTKKLGTIVVEKKVQGLPESEKDKEFSITIKNSENQYLKPDGTLSNSADGATVQIKVNAKAVFNHVPAGSYRVEELGTDKNGSAQVYGYTLTVSVDNNGAVVIADDDVKNVVVTNTYTPETTNFSFTKLWYGVDLNNPTEWMTDSITVTLNRSFSAKGKEPVCGDPITMTIFPKNGSSGYDYTVNKTEDPSISYSIEISGLEQYVPKDKLPEDVTSGEWVYTLAEAVPDGYYAHYYMNGKERSQGEEYIDDGGKIENHLITVELPSTGGSGTKLFTIIGSILVVSAGILLIRRRRRV